MLDGQFNEKEQQAAEILVARENFAKPHVWRNRNTFLQAAQKDRPARPQAMKALEA